jgi:hypothetical protein
MLSSYLTYQLHEDRDFLIKPTVFQLSGSKKKYTQYYLTIEIPQGLTLKEQPTSNQHTRVSVSAGFAT